MSVLNETRQEVFTGNSRLCLEIGSIELTQADAIVNSTKPNLQLDCGTLSSLILKAAGQTIQDECDLIYPKGITVNEVAITSGGRLDYVENIFHVTSTNFTCNVTCALSIEKIVDLCLEELIDNNLQSISFPPLGTGALKYPIEIVAKTMVSKCFSFLNCNQDYELVINIVIPNDLTETIKIFENEFSKLFSHQFKEDLQLNFEWKYEIKNNKWIDFPLNICKQIESAYNKDKTDVSFINEDNVQSMIWFKSMIYSEFNEESPIMSYNVRRDVLIKEEKLSLPSNWSSMLDVTDFSLIDVDELTNEYKEVADDFKLKMGTLEVIHIKVQRIQSKSLFEAYSIHKKRLKNKNFNENELKLWHGTKNESVESISKQGFNRSFCGINGVKFGKGVYFAVWSWYSHKFTDTLSDFGERKMFRARVLVGDSIVGNEETKVPPLKSNGDPYDSTCDPDRSIFVCYHDSQCYPEYLISYTSLS